MDILNIISLFLIIYSITSLILFLINLIKVKINFIELDRLLNSLVKRYDLDKSIENKIKISYITVFINSFIISIPLTIFIGMKVKYYIVILVSMLIIIPLMLALYSLLGIMLKKKGW